MSAPTQDQTAELRAAFVAGHRLGFTHGDSDHAESWSNVEAKREAARRYPDAPAPSPVVPAQFAPVTREFLAGTTR